jgi:ribosomal-protein-alanine N-acetyltransferase
MYGPLIRGERVVLRPPVPADAVALASWRATPDVARYAWQTSGGAPSQAQIEKQLADASGSRDLVRWTLERDGRPVGLTFISQINWTARHGYHGYAIGDTALWGKGIASEASALAVRFGFEGLGLNKIKAEVAARHLPSQRILEKTGFRRCGVFLQEFYVDGQAQDMVWFELLREEWLARNVAAGVVPTS